MTALSIIFLAVLLDGSEGTVDAPVELRALRSYLGLLGIEREAPSRPSAAGEIAVDLRTRLERFLDRDDLSTGMRSDGLAIYHELARSIAGRPAGGSGGSAPRDLYRDLVRRVERAGEDPIPIEVEMLASPAVGLGAQDSFHVLEGRMPALIRRAGSLDAPEAGRLLIVLERILAEPLWPELQEGAELTSILDLLSRTTGPDRVRVVEAARRKLVEWGARLRKAEASHEGELAVEAGIIDLYRAIEVASGDLDPDSRAAVLEGFIPLLPPSIAGRPVGSEGALRAAEVSEVHIAGGPVIPAIPPGGRDATGRDATGRYASGRYAPGRYAPGWLLVPGKAYRVKISCMPAGQGPAFNLWLLARADAEARLVLPRFLPQGMVPVTQAETGRIGFLADRRPWSVRRFLAAYQRCGTLVEDRAAADRLYRHTCLRHIPLNSEPSFPSIVGMLNDPSAREALKGTFWVDAGEPAGRNEALEIAASILTANGGLKDTALQLPTVAEAMRIIRDGELFEIDEPGRGLFNATRLVPEPGGERAGRYVIRTVLRMAP